MSKSGLSVIALAALLAACRYQPTPVPLIASAADISALAGDWSGEYSSVQSGRSGTISFTIRSGKDTAWGDVLMTPKRGAGIRAADANTLEHARHESLPELLQVTFVRVSGGMIEGTLEPYTAPDCQCVVTTVFQGTLKGNQIDGQYVTHGSMGLRQDGVWSMQRIHTSIADDRR